MNESERLNLLAQGVLVENSVGAEKLAALAAKLAPRKTNLELIRLGLPTDGGYLVPNDLDGVVACFSPGVSNYAHFEQDLQNRFGIGSHQADYSVEGPPAGFTPLSFTKKYLGSRNDAQFITLESWVSAQWEYDLGRDFILQMDIEGGEYDTLLATPDSILKKFRSVIFELHHLEDWANPRFYEIAYALISKLEKHFIVVHSHPNNYGGMINIGGFVMPRVIELTLARRDRCHLIEGSVTLPHPLDAPCAPHVPDIELPAGFR